MAADTPARSGSGNHLHGGAAIRTATCSLPATSLGTWCGPAPLRAGRVVPYLLGGAGFFRHYDRFGPNSFASNEGTFTAGGGARVWVSPAVYAGAEARFGWELHTRLAGTVGVRLGR